MIRFRIWISVSVKVRVALRERPGKCILFDLTVAKHQGP